MSASAPESLIRDEIARKGRLTFAEFMSLALYHPDGGYYTTPGRVGEGGDFFTSPTAHPAFGALLAAHLWRMWRSLGCPPRFAAVELGAGDGLLARDVCDYADTLSPAFAAALAYVAIERRRPGGPSREHGRVHPIVSDGVPLRGVTGCFIANELVDALPVHRFTLSGGELREIYVSLDANGRIVDAPGEPSTPALAERLAERGLELPDGFRGEICLELRPWLESVASALYAGYLLTIDYGYTAEELYSPQRAGGTLQTYYRHTDGGSPYTRIGQQDITAHVDFSSLAAEGERVGLATLGFGTQARYLASLGFGQMLDGLRRMRLGDAERNANRMGMLELVKPGGMGDFRVLLQGLGETAKGMGETDYAPPAPLEPPLLGAEHARLMAGRYPHAAWGAGGELEGVWPLPPS